MENKIVKIFAIVLALLIISAIINFVIMTITGRGKNYKVKLFAFGDKTKLIAQNEYNVSEMEKIEIDIKSSNVKIVEGQDDKIRVKIYGLEGEEYRLDTSNNKLSISKDSNEFYIFSFFFFVKQEVIVEVPSTYDKNVRNKDF